MSFQIKKSRDRFCSREYREFISRQQCFFCKSRECDPHHTTSRKWADGSDATCIPLCRSCHNLLHAGRLEKEISAVSVTFLQLEFMREYHISYEYPFTQQEFEGYLRSAGLVQPPFTRRKNR